MKIEGVKSFKITELKDKSVIIKLSCESQEIAGNLFNELNNSCKEGQFSLSFNTNKS